MSVWKDKRLKSWRYRFQYLGVQHTGSGYQTRRAAEKARGDKRKEEIEKQGRTTRTAFSVIANQYLDDSKRRHAKQTYLYKSHIYADFIKTTGDLPIHAITPAHIKDHLDRQPTNNQWNIHRKELSTLFNWTRRILRIDVHNPCQELDKMPHEAGEKAIPSEENVLRVVAAADGDERDIILCCLHTMGRIDEVLRLRWADVNFDKGSVTLWTRKRKGGEYEPDHLPLSEGLRSVLWGRWKSRGDETWVFYNPDTRTRYNHRPRLMRGVCKRAGVPYFGFHSLRHFMASYLADKAKVSTPIISSLLRHKNIRTTEIYLHSVDSSHREAIGAVDAFFTPENTNRHTTSAHME